MSYIFQNKGKVTDTVSSFFKAAEENKSTCKKVSNIISPMRIFSNTLHIMVIQHFMKPTCRREGKMPVADGELKDLKDNSHFFNVYESPN